MTTGEQAALQDGPPSPCENAFQGQQEMLRELRADLDAVDRIILNALLMRHHCTRRIGVLKKSKDIPVMQSGRVRFVLERATDFALENGMNPLALQDVFATLISDACREEEGHSAPVDAARERISLMVGGVERGAHPSH
ncbi:chorismate mutase [Streptomyces sp. NPDC014894]|uniref:chorismate mutase n=1 Tax=unclassified Streptomyces TaxID=2593676 RepID=UPI0036F71A93